MHMFDIDVPGGIRFQESEVLSPGSGFLTFDTGMPVDCYKSYFGNVQFDIETAPITQNGVRLV